MERSEEIKQLKDLISKILLRLEALEREEPAEPKRHTHSTGACFDDSLAVALDIIITEAEQREYTHQRIEKLVSIIQQGRQSPHSYPIDPPAGKRPKRGGT